jgi:hypothetical protein
MALHQIVEEDNKGYKDSFPYLNKKVSNIANNCKEEALLKITQMSIPLVLTSEILEIPT